MDEEHKKHYGEKSHKEKEHSEHTHHRVKSKSSNSMRSINKLTIWRVVFAVLGILLMLSLFTWWLDIGGSPSIGGIAVKEAQPKQVGADEPSQQANLVDMDSVADDDDFLGPEDAKVTVVEFSDFECSYCAAVAGTNPGLIQQLKSIDPNWEAPVPKLKELAKQGKIKFVYRDFPLKSHKNAQKAAEAAECAGEQGRFWEMYDELFENGVSGGVDSYKQFASDIRLNTAEFNDCLDSGEMAFEVQKDFEDGAAAGISRTPGFIVNGKLVSGAQPFSVFEKLIEEGLAK